MLLLVQSYKDCIFFSAVYILLYYLQFCTLCIIQVNLAFAVVLEIKSNAAPSTQVVISMILMHQFFCEFIHVSLRGDIFHSLWHIRTSVPSPPPILIPHQSHEGSAGADVPAHHHTWKTTSGISTATWILHFLFSIVTQGSVSIRAGKHFSGKEAALWPWSIVCKAHREIPWATHALLILVVPLKRTD